MPARALVRCFRSPGLVERVSSKAMFSEDLLYRYALRRVWDRSKPIVCYLMLNPSKADERFNDPTVERCEQRARAMGFGGYTIVNLFAFRATDPLEMMDAEDPVGSENDKYILQAVQKSSMVICAWGNGGSFMGRAEHVEVMLRLAGFSPKMFVLKFTSRNQPQHPLYLSHKQKPERWICAG